MKKTIILILILMIGILIYFSYTYNNYKKEKEEIIEFNAEYEYYYDREIYGADLATIINKITNNNTKYNIEKDNKGNYIEDDQNSIKMDIYIIDSDTTYSMERIYSLGTEQFVKNFNLTKFKCTNIEYHEQNNKVKYLYFVQTSD